MTDHRLTSALFSSDGMRAIFSSNHTVQCMLDVEAALARALAQEGKRVHERGGEWPEGQVEFRTLDSR